MRTRHLLVFALGLAALGCGNAQPAVNRVQPNVVEKTIFNDGSAWYFLQTVIDSPYSAPYTFVGEQGTTEKIIWDIQEEYLIARRAYQQVAGADGEGIAGGNIPGAAIAMYKIQKHFDIRRSYNPITGEEQNIIEENDYDRPWYEREFMRVDWSENLITNNDFLLGAKLFDGIQMEPVAYFVPPGTGHPHEPKFVTEPTESEDEEGRVHYIDIVNKMFVRPTTAYIEGFGEIPTCFLNGSSHLDCAPGEITVRNSFLRVEAARDYEPMEYTGDRMERFGYFVTERPGYDPEYGAVESARIRFVNRHNLWAQSHRRDASGGLIRCTESTEMAICGGNGSRCDLAYGMARREEVNGEWAGACTIPYRERQVRPIAYHLSRNFPEDLKSDSQSVADDWNEVFVTTVASLRENECLEAGGDAAACAGERARADHQQMFVLCQNPVAEGDHEACGPIGTSAQIGDLRYSMIGWVNEPHASAPLGYGPSSADPETGEIIMGNAFMYGAGVETLQAFARDIIGLLTGDLRESDITSGDVVEAWVERNREPGARGTSASVAGVDGNVENPMEGMDFSWVQRFRSSGTARPAPTTVGELVTRVRESQQQLRRSGAFGDDVDLGGARLQNLVGTDIERMLTPTEIRIARGIDPNAAVDDATLNQASPVRGFGLRGMEAMQRAHDQMHRLGHCRIHAAEFTDEGLLGLARAVQRAVEDGDGVIEWYGQSYQLREADGSVDYRAVSQMLRHPMFHGVTSHEIGHTVGLRHNFSGSYDAMNYAPRFWELRDDGNMRPRAWDPITDAEIDGRIHEYQYSTVMDYGNNFVVTDAHGLGRYDAAAIKMGYGDLVEVFEDVPTANQRELAWFSFFQSNWPVPLKISAFEGGELSAYNYTDIPDIVGSREALERRVDVPYRSLRPFPELASNGIADPMVDAQGRLGVPYLFCSDEQRDLGPDCYLYDMGADTFETVNSVIDNYWNYYIFNAFRRGRLGFDTGPYADRIYGRYFEKLKYANQIYSLYTPIFIDIFGEEQAEQFLSREDGMAPYTLAVQSAFRLFTRVVATPEPGSYVRTIRGDGSEALIAGGGSFGGVGVSAFDGRAIETTWNFDDGYFWFDQLERVGYFYDKILAIMALTDPQTNFLGRDTSADVRQYQINFYSSFGPAMQGFLGGLWGDDWSTIAPRAVGSELVYPSPAQLAGATMPGLPIEPNASFSIQLYSAVYGMAWIPETFDRSFFQRSRIWIRGGADEVTPDASVSTVEFTDSRTGLTYVAISYPDDGGLERGPAALMVLHAQALAANDANGELDAYIDNLDVMRRLGWSYDLGR